jgi:hypothetical protein
MTVYRTESGTFWPGLKSITTLLVWPTVAYNAPMSKPHYLIRKVDKQGEDVAVDAVKFDALLNRMVSVDPLTYKELQKKPKIRKDGKRKQNKRS